MKLFPTLALALLSSALPAQAGGPPDPAMKTPPVERLPFGEADGRAIELYALRNTRGAVAKIITYGARVTELRVPDRGGHYGDVVLGFDRLEGYLAHPGPYFGAIVGRVGNRIARGRFTLDGRTYQLATNNGPNHLHGGIRGFDKVVWDARIVADGPGAAVEFSYLSPDGEEGYPGNCRVTARYTLTEGNELRIDYTVHADRDTPVNVTNHSYFNLAGPAGGSILDHEMMINADRFTPVDATLIPTGELKPVAGTPMDFTRAQPIGSRLKAVGGDPVGYDHNYVINGGGGALALVARVYEPKSGRLMEVASTEPGVQFYSGNFLDGTFPGKRGTVYAQYAGFCLETQHFPDSVNHPNFPSSVLKAGATYRSTTVFRFLTR